METKKMGRPTQDPKTERKNIRLSQTEIEKLNFCIEKTGKSGNEIIRMGIDKVYQELKK
ncbi:MAG: hypothetical protein K2L42_07155 [Clostridia bacterium]|nr:hypothetical protein [Clostridia bacterium]